MVYNFSKMFWLRFVFLQLRRQFNSIWRQFIDSVDTNFQWCACHVWLVLFFLLHFVFTHFQTFPLFWIWAFPLAMLRYYARCWLPDCSGSPGVSNKSFHSMRLIYPSVFRMTLGFLISGSVTQTDRPHIRFLFVASSVCLRLPSDSRLPGTPLPSTIGFRSSRLL